MIISLLTIIIAINIYCYSMLLVLIIVMFGSYDSDYQPYVCLCFCLLGDINIDDIQ